MSYDAPARSREHLDKALEIIRRSEVPVSTTELILRLNLKKNKGIGLRRCLKGAAEKGTIRCLGAGVDGSLAWISSDVSIGKSLAHVVNMYLSVHAGMQIDTNEFEELAHTLGIN